MTSRLADLAARWQQAEARLYPVAMVDPERYAAHLRLIRAVADDLSSCDSVEDLLAAHAERAAHVRDAAARAGVPPEDLDVESLAGAAFSLRYRELVGEAERREASASIRAAGGRPQWVRLHERGRPGDPGYRLLEMRVPDGLGLLASVDASLDAGGLVHEVETVRLDPATGDLVARSRASEALTFRDPEAWREAIDRLRENAEPAGPAEPRDVSRTN